MSKKTVVITGASSGIGLGLAKAFIDNGYNVVGSARAIERLLEAANNLGNPDSFIGVAGYVADPETARNLFATAIETFGSVDVLVNNAGFFLPRPFTDYSPEDLEALLDTNLKGVVYTTQVAVEHMRHRGDGHIVNITAALAIQPNIAVPAALPLLIKGGINQMTRALALELSPYNIKVNAVAPGIINTPMHDPSTHEFLSNLSPFGRLGTVDEIADAVLYLAKAGFTTGAVLPVDGGQSTGKW